MVAAEADKGKTGNKKDKNAPEARRGRLLFVCACIRNLPPWRPAQGIVLRPLDELIEPSITRPQEEELSEEDLALKEKLEQWVEQIKTGDSDAQCSAVEGMSVEIRCRGVEARGQGGAR